jgi:hypothetical protein
MLGNPMIRQKQLLPFIAVASILSACSLTTSNIKQIDALIQVQDQLDAATPQTLVVFDMDHTMINPQESMFNFLCEPASIFEPSDQKFIKEMKANFDALKKEKKDPDYGNKVLSAVWQHTHFKQVEPNTVALIKKMQERTIKIIALTASNTGRFWNIENMQQWRLDNLREIGLDFSSSFNLQTIEITNLNKQYGFYPVFYKGILCAAGNPKGIVLAAFLEKIGLRPDKILFFDDNIQQCQSVELEMKKLSIPVQCYYYRAAFKEKIKLNHDVIRYQFEHWVKHEEYIPEREVLNLLDHVPTTEIIKNKRHIA